MEASNENQPAFTARYYTEQAISIATFFGGPLAAGILLRQNFLNQGRKDAGNRALWISIVASALILFFLLYLPDSTLDKIPNIAIPGLYTAIIMLWLRRTQSHFLNEHRDNQGQFYSGGRAALIGVLCAIIWIGSMVGYIYLGPQKSYSKEFNAGLDQLTQYESEALSLYDILEQDDSTQVIQFIEKQGLPALLNCLRTLDKMERIQGLDETAQEQLQTLREYYQLRMKSFGLINKSIKEGTTQYDGQIDGLYEEMEVTLGKLE